MKEKSDSRKNFENLREILEQMKNKKTGYKYEEIFRPALER
ncbi:MAG: hypothetical protein NTZ02_02800 [Candidatus Woesearchaeota archaeon]|nr:hypothetical protein [Candidatus Woesearchaeota archaeon]